MTGAEAVCIVQVHYAEAVLLNRHFINRHSRVPELDHLTSHGASASGRRPSFRKVLSVWTKRPCFQTRGLRGGLHAPCL